MQGRGLGPDFYQPFPTAASPRWNVAVDYPAFNYFTKSWFPINTVAKGGTTVTLKTPADASYFPVGMYVIVVAQENQYTSMWNNFQYAKVTAANAGTGVITIDRPLKYEFRDDYPVSQGPNPQNGLHCSALLVATDADQNTLYVKGTANLTTNYVPWDIDHLYKNMRIMQGENGIHTYMSVTGRKIVHENNFLEVGPSETMTEYFSMVNCTVDIAGEPTS